MKKIKLLLTFIFICVASIGFSQGIDGSAHDFEGETWTTEICNVCHTPHGSNQDVADMPLWNRAASVETYTLYTSLTFDGTGTQTQPDGASKLCLGCHDATIALENFGGVTTGTDFVTKTVGAGSTLIGEHPISFDYTSATATTDGGLFDPSVALSGLPGGGTIAVDLLVSDRLECSSCHDVHDAVGNASLLVVSNANSALCLTCHDK